MLSLLRRRKTIPCGSKFSAGRARKEADRGERGEGIGWTRGPFELVLYESLLLLCHGSLLWFRRFITRGREAGAPLGGL